VGFTLGATALGRSFYTPLEGRGEVEKGRDDG
jgi:hypothetical protein